MAVLVVVDVPDSDREREDVREIVDDRLMVRVSDGDRVLVSDATGEPDREKLAVPERESETLGLGTRVEVLDDVSDVDTV